MPPDRIWWAAATTVVVAGLVLLPLTVRPGPAAPGAVATGLIVLAMSGTVRLAGGTRWPVALPRALGDALLGAVFTLALQGWVGLAGPLAAAGAVLLLAATSPPVVRWLRGRSHGRPHVHVRVDHRPSRRPTPPVRPLLRPQDVAAMTTAAIGASWRRTARELPHTQEPHRRAQLAELRRLYLDELERRDHEGFRSWLDAGPRAGSDPTRFIDPGTHHPTSRTDPRGGDE